MDYTIWAGIGIAASILYVAAYAALQLGLIRGRSFTYTGLNLAAAAFALLSLNDAFNISTLLTSSFWLALSILGLIRLIRAQTRLRFTPEEQTFLSRHFSTLPPHLARKFLSLGRWQSVSPGTVLTRQGTPVHELVYLAEGAADVSAHGAKVAELGANALIGELTILHGGEATADVEVTEPTRLFTLPRGALLRELESDHDFALAVSGAVQVEAQRKLDEANRTRAEGLTAGAVPVI